MTARECDTHASSRLPTSALPSPRARRCTAALLPTNTQTLARARVRNRKRLVLSREEQRKADAEYLHYHKCLLRCAEHVADEQMKACKAAQEKLEEQQDAIKSHGGIGGGGGGGTGFWRVFGGGRSEAKGSGIAPSGPFVLPSSSSSTTAAKLGVDAFNDNGGSGGGGGDVDGEDDDGSGGKAERKKKKKSEDRDRGTGIWALANVFRGLSARDNKDGSSEKEEEEEGEGGEEEQEEDAERFMGLDHRRPTIHDDDNDDEEEQVEMPASGQPLEEFTDSF